MHHSYAILVHHVAAIDRMQRPWLRNDTDTVNHGGTGQPNSLNQGYEQSAHLDAGPYPDRVRPSRNNVHTIDDAEVGERLERREPVHRTVPGPLSKTVLLERVDSPQPGERRSGRAGSPIGPLNCRTKRAMMDGRPSRAARFYCPVDGAIDPSTPPRRRAHAYSHCRTKYARGDATTQQRRCESISRNEGEYDQ